MRFRHLEPESEDLLHVDLLRLTACLLVVLHHVWPYFHPPEARQAFAGAHLSWHVIIEQFFAISGFVIAFVYSERVGTLKAYALYVQRRAARVYPLHLAVFGAFGALLAVALATGMPISTPFDLSASCLASTAILTQVYAGCAGATLNFPAWTVSVEILLYLAFPLIVAIRRHALPLGFAGVAAMYLLYAPADDLTQLHPALRGLASFTFGTGIFYARRWLSFIPAPRAWLAALSALYVVALLSLSGTLVAMPLAYAVFMLAAAADGRKGAGPIVRSLAGYGQLTYSIYMLHALVIALLMGGAAEGLLGLSGPALGATAAATVAAIALLSYLSYVGFEMPARRWLGNLGRPRRQAAIAPYVFQVPGLPPATQTAPILGLAPPPAVGATNSARSPSSHVPVPGAAL